MEVAPLTIHVPAVIASLVAYVAAWSAAHLPGVSRPLLAILAIAAGWFAGLLGARLLAALARVLLLAFGCLVAYALYRA